MSPEALPVVRTERPRATEVTFGPFAFDPRRRLLRNAGREIPLPPRVLGVLELLLARQGDVVSRQEIIDTVWKDAFVTDTSLAEAVSFLRQALGDDSQAPVYIQTVHRRGYRFLPALEQHTPPVAAAPPVPELAPAIETARPSIVNELLPWSVAILATTLGISALWYATKLEPTTPPTVTIAFSAGDGFAFDHRAPALAISASGSRVAWSGCRAGACQLFVRPLDQLTGRAILGTDGAAAPFFSPDERWLGFFADGKLKKVALAGGAPQVITDATQPFGAAWMADGRIVFAASAAGGLMRVRDDGGDLEAWTTPAAGNGEIRHAYPTSVRDGDALLFVVATSPLPGATGRLALIPYPAARAPWRTMTEGADAAVAVGHEYIAFARGSDVHAVAFDRVRQTVSGLEQVVATNVIAPHIASSSTGAFAAVVGVPPAAASPARWEWTESRASPLNGLDDLRDARLSPDGSRIAGVGVEARPDVWSVDLQRGTKTRITFTGSTATPVWNATGTEILYAVRRSGPYEVWARAASATGDERRLLSIPDRHVFPASVSRTGDIAFVQTGGPTRSDVGLLRAGQATPSRVLETAFDETAPALSPDGTLLACQTDESGRWEVVLVYLRQGRRLPVSTSGGTRPFWSSDGRSLFFQRGDELMVVAIDSAGQPVGGERSIRTSNDAVLIGIAPDGNVLFHRDLHPRSGSGVLTLQWITELRSKLGPPTAASPR
jgi:DNA-binding winged helix-turn-helix (wHTH) protein/Tol biopolymer transport system component